jgi:hypothetical protein
LVRIFGVPVEIRTRKLPEYKLENVEFRLTFSVTCRGEDNIKRDLKEIVWKLVNLIYLAQVGNSGGIL